MKKTYCESLLEIFIFETEDVIKTSNTFEKGDDVGEDFFD